MRAISLVLAIGLTIACSSKKKDAGHEAEPPVQTPPSQTPGQTPSPAAKPKWYRVELLAADDTRIPFFLAVPPPDQTGATMLMGARTSAVDIAWQGDRSFKLPFRILSAELSAAIADDGTLAGKWTLDSKAWGKHELTLRGVEIDDPGKSPLFEAATGEAARDTSGVWRLNFSTSGIARLKVSCAGKRAEALLTFSTGNRVALSGNSTGNTLRLAAFDGSTPSILIANLETGEGEWKAGPSMEWRETFKGAPSADFDIQTGLTVDNPGGVQVEGVDLGALAGKPHIVELAASWCATCKYAMPFLVEVYSEFHPKGLEMITLAYEFTEDEAHNDKMARALKEEYSLPWDVIAVHGSSDDMAEIMPRGLDGDLSGFPISIFVSRSGKIVDVHAGFAPDPDTPEYKKLSAEYRGKVERLLAAP
jgi:thiol-disulfide isomerase/thioredoxin